MAPGISYSKSHFTDNIYCIAFPSESNGDAGFLHFRHHSASSDLVHLFFFPVPFLPQRAFSSGAFHPFLGSAVALMVFSWPLSDVASV